MLFLRSESAANPRLDKVIEGIFTDTEGQRIQRDAIGDTPFKRMLDLLFFTEWVANYMSLLNGINPAPQVVTEYLVRGQAAQARYLETEIEVKEDRKRKDVQEAVVEVPQIPFRSGQTDFTLSPAKMTKLSDTEIAVLETRLNELRKGDSFIRSFLDTLESRGVRIKFAQLEDDLTLRVGDDLYLDKSLLEEKTYKKGIHSILLRSVLIYQVNQDSYTNALTEDRIIEDTVASLTEMEELAAIYFDKIGRALISNKRLAYAQKELVPREQSNQKAGKLRAKLELARSLAEKSLLNQRKEGYRIKGKEGVKEVLQAVIKTRGVGRLSQKRIDALAEQVLREREIRILQKDLEQFRSNHIEELKSKDNAWDYIFLAAANEAQADAFRKELEYRRNTLDSFQPHTIVDVVSPPNDQNIDNGGATLYAVRKAAEAIANEEKNRGRKYKNTEEVFKDKRILVILSGGDSKRIPIFSATGKAFTTVPTELETGTGGNTGEQKPTSTLFDEIYTMLSGAAGQMKEGLVVIPGDAQVIFDYNDIELVEDENGKLDGLVEVVWRAPWKEAINHGVRVTEKDLRISEKNILAKSVEAKSKADMDAVKAIGEDGSVNLSTAVIKADVDAMARMAELGGFRLDQNSGRPIQDDSLKGSVMEKAKIELYGHILPVFATEMDEEEYVIGSPEAPYPSEMQEARKRIWDAFRDEGNSVEYHIQSTTPFIFADFGTTEQFYEHLTTRDDVNRVYQFRSWMNHFVDMGVDVTEESKIYDSILIGREGQVQPGAIIIYSKLDKGFKVGRGSIVYGVQDSQGQLKLNDNSVIYQLPITIEEKGAKKGTSVSVLFGREDDPKKLSLYGEYVAYEEGKEDGINKKGNSQRHGNVKTMATLFGRNFFEWLEEKGITPDDVWDESVQDEERNLWNAKLYVPGDVDFRMTLWMQEEGIPEKEILDECRENKRVSMEEVVSLSDHARLFTQRDEIRKDPRILRDRKTHSEFDRKLRGVWDYVLSNSLKETDLEKRLVRYDPAHFDDSDIPDETERKESGELKTGRRGNLIVRYDPRRGKDGRDEEVEANAVPPDTQKVDHVLGGLRREKELLEDPLIAKDNRYKVFANLKPIFANHILLVSEESRPQVLTESDIESSLAIIRDNNIRLYFNGWGAAASENYFHLHGFYGYSDEYQPVETDNLPVENAPVEPLFKVGDVKVGRVAEYPATALVFEADEETALSRVFHDFVHFLQRKDVNVPHNILFTRNKIFIYLKATEDRKTITTDIDINPATPELSGIITVKARRFKDNLPTLEDLQKALKKATVSEDKLEEILSGYLSVLQQGKGLESFLVDREVNNLSIWAKHGDNPTRLNAVRRLSQIKNPYAVSVLIEALGDKFYAVYLEAARGLGEIKDKKAVDALVEVLESKEEGKLSLKREAIISLGKIGDSTAIAALGKSVLNDPNLDEILRKAAAWALGEIGGKEAFDILLSTPHVFTNLNISESVFCSLARKASARTPRSSAGWS